MLRLTVYGKAVPQGRPRFARIGAFVRPYDPKESRDYKQMVKDAVVRELKINHPDFKPYEHSVYVGMIFYRSIPKSFSKKKFAEAVAGTLRPTSKPDLDNTAKSILDALTGITWKDDAVISDLHLKKRYTDGMERVELLIKETNENAEMQKVRETNLFPEDQSRKTDAVQPG